MIRERRRSVLPMKDTPWRVQALLDNTVDLLSICFLITAQTLHKTHGNVEHSTDIKVWQPTDPKSVCMLAFKPIIASNLMFLLQNQKKIIGFQSISYNYKSISLNFVET